MDSPQAMTDNIHTWAEDELNRRFPGYNALRHEIAANERVSDLLRRCYEDEIVDGMSLSDLYDTVLEVGQNNQLERLLIAAGALEKVDSLDRAGGKQIIVHEAITTWLARSLNLHRHTGPSGGGFPVAPASSEIRRTLAYLGALHRQATAGSNELTSASGSTPQDHLLKERLAAQVTAQTPVQPTIAVISFGRLTKHDRASLSEWKPEFLRVLGYDGDADADPMSTTTTEHRRYDEYVLYVEGGYADSDQTSIEETELTQVVKETLLRYFYRALPRDTVKASRINSAFTTLDHATLPRVFGNVTSESPSETEYYGPNRDLVDDHDRIFQAAWLYQCDESDGDADE